MVFSLFMARQILSGITMLFRSGLSKETLI
jgi:hypothetical protein